MAEIGPYATVSTGLDIAGLRDTIHILKAAINRFDHDPTVRSAAQRITAAIPNHDDTGEIAAVYHWLLTYIAFRKDPSQKELIESPAKILKKVQSGQPVGIDCDDFVVLAGSLLQALGHDIRFAIEGTEQAGVFEHIHLEVFDEAASQWYAFDPSLSNAPLGTPLQGLLSRWVESARSGPVGFPPPIGVIDAELGDTHPCAIGLAPDDYPLGAVVHVGDRQWVRDGAEDNGARYWRYAGWLGTDRAMSGDKEISIDIIEGGTCIDIANDRLGQANTVSIAPGTIPEVGLQPGTIPKVGLQPGTIDRQLQYLANPEIYILLTQPNVNPLALRRAFGFASSPAERRQYRAELTKVRAEQADRYVDDVMNDPSEVKIADPGYIDGDSAAEIFEYFGGFLPEERPPIPPEDPPSGMEDFTWWKDFWPGPEELGFSRDPWFDLEADQLLATATVQQGLEFIQAFTGINVAPELYGTAEANTFRFDLENLDQPLAVGLGRYKFGDIFRFIKGVIKKIAKWIWSKITWVSRKVRQVAKPIVCAIVTAKAGKEAGKFACKIITVTDSVHDAISGHRSWKASGRAFKKFFGQAKSAAIEYAIAQADLERLYEFVERYGFDSPEAAPFREAVEMLAAQGGDIYVFVKGFCLQALTEIKQQALDIGGRAMKAFDDLVEEMLAAGGVIAEWAREYADLPFDAENLDVPGTPPTAPPDTLPPGQYPYTSEDAENPEGEPGWDPNIDEDEVAEDFGEILDEQARGASASGLSWWGAGVQWSGETKRDLYRKPIGRDPGRGPDVDLPPMDTLPDYNPNIDPFVQPVGDRITTFVSAHPIITTAGVAGAGFGLFKLFKYWKIRGA